MADLAVIVVAHNSAAWLEPCLSSVFAHAGGAELDVIVVDNESSDGSADLVRDSFPDVRLLSSENRGFAHGNNRGILASDAPFVLFLNADTEVLTGSFDALLSALRRRPEIGLIGCRQTTPDGALWPTIRRFPSPTRTLFEALGSEHFPFTAPWLGERELDLTLYDRWVECDWTSGSFMLARRSALQAAGLMDERFFIYCEEPDLCLRIKRAGFEVWHVPEMTILHHAGRSGLSPQFEAQDAYARRQYMQKHFSRPQRAISIAAFTVGHVLRAALKPARRASSIAALRTIAGLDPPPFGEGPRRALDLEPDADQGVTSPIPK